VTGETRVLTCLTAATHASLARDDWMISAPKRAQPARANESTTESRDGNQSAASVKELNPELNPDTTLRQRDYRVGDGGRGWRERALQRQREHVTDQGTDSRTEHERESRDERATTRATQGRGWRKSDTRARDEHVTAASSVEQVTPVTAQVTRKPRITSAEQLSEEDRNLLALDENKLAAQLVKAEMLGNQEHVTRLRDQLTRIRELKSQLRARDTAEQDEHVVLISPLDSQGRARVSNTARDHGDQSRASTVAKPRGLHDEKGERQEYFTDDNISLEEMVRREVRCQVPARRGQTLTHSLVHRKRVVPMSTMTSTRPMSRAAASSAQASAQCPTRTASSTRRSTSSGAERATRATSTAIKSTTSAIDASATRRFEVRACVHKRQC
jgi:hypothetical protein